MLIAFKTESRKVEWFTSLKTQGVIERGGSKRTRKLQKS